MKSKFSHLLKLHARQIQPAFDPALHERILNAVLAASAAPKRRRARLWRLPGAGLALALAACVVMALSFPLIFQRTPPQLQPVSVPQIVEDCPTPHAILALNIEPASQQVLNALSPDVAMALASLNEIPRFIQDQCELIQASE